MWVSESQPSTSFEVDDSSIHTLSFFKILRKMLCSCFNTFSRYLLLFLEFLLFYQFGNLFTVCFITIGHRKLGNTMNLLRQHVFGQFFFQIFYQCALSTFSCLDGQVQFVTDSVAEQRNGSHAAGSLEKRLGSIFYFTQFYPETLYFHLIVFTSAINNIPVAIQNTQVSGPVIDLSVGTVYQNQCRFFRVVQITFHYLPAGYPKFSRLSLR